jgi:hypothetical protein
VHARYHAAIRRREDDAVLVLRDGAMPGLSVEDAPPWPVIEPVVAGLRAEHRLRVEALRTVWVGGPSPDDMEDRLVEVALVDGPLPAGSRWVPLAELDRRPTPLGQAIDGGVLQSTGGYSQPWYRPGWLAEMTAWVDERLAATGGRRRGDAVQVRSWGRSALLRVETDRGRLWAKQVPVVFAHEVAVTTLLADVDPGFVPPVVAADPAVGRILTEHVEGPLLTASDGVPPEAWAATLGRLAEVQRVLAADLAAVRAAGVPAAPVAGLADAVPLLVADPEVALVGQDGGLSVGEHRALVDAIPLLVEACRALAASSIGDSLEHGDLSPGQVVFGEMGPVVLDWSDSTVTHPFLAAASFLADHRELPADPAVAAAALAEAYLAGWGGDHAAAARALELARVVHPLHVAWLTAERILPGLEQPWEMAHVVPGAFRRLKDRLADLPRILAS